MRLWTVSIGQSLDELTASPARTALATLGMAIGVGAVVTTLVLIDGFEQYVRDQITATTDVQSMTVASRTVIMRDGFAYPVNGYPVFGSDQAVDLAGVLERTAEVTMSATGTAVVESPRAEPHEVTVNATLANFLRFRRKDVEAGRYFTDGEAAHNAPVAVLSHLLAVELSPSSDPATMLGRSVRLRARAFTVIGVMPSYTGERDFELYVPLRAASTTFSASGPITPSFLVRARRLESVSAVRADVEDWLARRYRQWDRRVSITSQAAQFEQVMTALLVLKFTLGSLAGIALVVGGVGIMNVQLASVAERTREIGVRKSVGAGHRDVLAQFLSESVIIAAIGSTVGMVIGFGAAEGLAALARVAAPGSLLRVVLTPATLATAVVSAVVIGLASGTLPAVRAARLAPVDAMRRE